MKKSKQREREREFGWSGKREDWKQRNGKETKTRPRRKREIQEMKDQDG